MLNQTYLAMLSNKNIIRNINEFAMERAKVIGYENVYDFSLGNPSVAPHEDYTKELIRLLAEEDPMKLHGYSPILGIPSVRQAVAESLTRRFGVEYTADGIFMCSGAAAAISHAARAVAHPGQDIITFAPFFTEYRPYLSGGNINLKVVPANTVDFQIRFDLLEEMLDSNTAAVLINSPNNPSGVVYTAETLTRLAQVLTKKSQELGRPIYLISDEPYREIVFGGKTQPYPASFYPHTISCYSFSKSLSLPGDRIGYVATTAQCQDWDKIIPMCAQISRTTGHNCPTALIQLAISKVLDVTSDLSVYETNASILYKEMKRMGFDVQEPGGTFYIFPKALEEDDWAFCEKAKEFDVLGVPGSGFGVPGYFRLAYCIDTEKVERSLPALQKLANYYL
ncbi:MAG: pyridoxal phosphate-dependent aminotransferase [Oscillospiraceae bacterium]|nr:pyridoxal phosphate-dependent aminotransferase [Oscillospiraceae bacterium]